MPVKTNLKKAKVAALALLGAVSMAGMPISANAAETSVTVPSSGTADQSVTATFTIDNDTLVDLGYGAVVSVPVTMPLSYKNETKTFEGSKSVYCSGIIASGKKVTVKVDEMSTLYGQVRDKNADTYSVKGKEDFSVTLSKTEWSQSEMSDNLAKANAGNTDEITKGTLSVKIPGKGFVPKVTGDFHAMVPLVIKQEDVN